MDVLFLDANILFSAAYKEHSHLRWLWTLEGVELVTSTYAAEEARRNLGEEDRRERLELLLSSLRVVPEAAPGGSGTELPDDVRLPDDDVPILLAAIRSGATHLVTSNHRDFGPLYDRQIQGVRILPPAEYRKSRPSD